ncbi:phosphate/phosphite/phosphonate ABC transporter substrate-binding protein [Pseudomonas sp. FME51]|uniref:phosphate/phosphite/phosphonate ABC transporter substrate-binding protein n=1 Tax=Pseudomonas sp. FME51 TaxID=2742609 RepID=UPI001865B845|nr:phosphate/phosphite/phosphonate ABC transporter substrate-binding protein [Pseudomonas sp. FME51]
MRIFIRILQMLLCLYSPVMLAEASLCGEGGLRISAVPVKNIDELIKEYQPLAELLSDGLNMPVQILRSSSYEAVIDAVVSGGADIALLGPASYLMAHQQNNRVEAFASMVLQGGHFSPAGDYYQALLVVRGDSAMRSLGDTRGGRVALNDPASTSGALIPNKEFPASAGIPLNQHFAGQVYTGSHDKTLDALLEGRVDAAFVSSVRADEYLRRGLISVDALRVLWRSAPIHYDPFVFSSEVCPQLKARVRELLLEQSPRMSAFLRSRRAVRIIPVSHQAYEPLLQLMTPR